jgi:immunity protein, SdpI family
MPRRRPRHASVHAIIAIGYAVGAAAWYVGFPAHVPPVVRVSSRGAIWAGDAMAALLLPSAAVFTSWLVRRLDTRPAREEPASPAERGVLDAVLLRLTLFIVALHVMVLLGLFGILSGRGWATALVPMMLGLTIIGVGNLLPRTRPNLAVGVRTRRLLSDRTLWIRVHRTLGHVTVGLGVVVVLGAVVLPPPVGPLMILAAGPVGLLVAAAILVRTTRQAHG